MLVVGERINTSRKATRPVIETAVRQRDEEYSELARTR